MIYKKYERERERERKSVLTKKMSTIKWSNGILLFINRKWKHYAG